MMNTLLKNTAKFAVGTCFALGAAAVAASVVAGSHVGKIVSAGFKGTKTAVQKGLAAWNTEATAEETIADKVETSPADFEN